MSGDDRTSFVPRNDGLDMAREPLTKMFYTPKEVAAHCTPDDCWVSLLGYVYDLTKLLAKNSGPLAKPLLEAAGTDISHWFDPTTGDVLTCVDPVSNLRNYYTPYGRFIHVPPPGPRADWDTSYEMPWWQDMHYRIGRLSKKTRLVRIKNVLTNQEDLLKVPSEETVEEIQERYLAMNRHAKSYTWKAMKRKPFSEAGGEDVYEFVYLDMQRTLADNGLLDESDMFDRLGMEIDCYVPVIHIYYNDDLTIA